MNEGIEETARLVRAAQAGDREAFGALYGRYARVIHGVLLAHLSGHDVEDLVQEAFLHAMHRLQTLRDPASFGAWIASIARTRAIDYLRRQRPADALPDDVPEPQPDRAEAIWVLQAIRELPMAYRETLTLRLVEGMTGPEIAARTGLTEPSVRVNLCRGMSQLRARLGAHRHTQDGGADLQVGLPSAGLLPGRSVRRSRSSG